MTDVAQVGMKFATEVPRMDRRPIPATHYTDPERFEQEREKIFKRAWLRLCRGDELPQPGNFRTIEVPTWGASVVVTRGNDRRIHAFLNICQHRGMSISTCERGRAEAFMCGFHGWVYDLDGSLRTVPGEQYFEPLDHAKLRAPALAVEEWCGFVFVNWQPEPQQSLREYLGEMGAFIEQHPFDLYERTGSYRVRVKANWKIVAEAFLEGYHVGTVHRRSIPDSMNSPENPLGLPNSCRVYGDHRTMAVWANPEHQPTATEALMWKHAFALQPGQIEAMPGANPDRVPTWWFDTNMFFPYFTVFIGMGWYLTYDLWPVSVDEAIWETHTYGMRAQTASQRLGADYMKVMLRDALMEDFSTCEHVQRNLQTGRLPYITLSEDMEYFVRHLHWTVDQWLAR